MNERDLEFVAQHQSAAMTTLRKDGSPHTVRVGVAVIDSKVWSSGTQTRARTKHLRRDPRATLFVFDTDPTMSWRFLTLQCAVRILDGPDAPDQNLRLFQQLQAGLPTPPKPGYVQWFGQDKTIEEFLQAMRDEQRLIYEFDVKNTYGLH
mgnify:CR=1 FL=1